MKLLQILFICILTSFSVLGNDINTEEWHLKYEKENFLIYTKKVPHHSVKEIKMTGIISGNSLSSFVALFQDLESYTDWVYTCVDAKPLENKHETELIYYLRSDFPWPMSDRDFVVHNKIWQNPETGAFHSKSRAHNDYIDEYEEVVRVTYFDAEWIITPLENGKYKLLYTFGTDPAGNIPAWIVNTFVDVGPLKTIKNMEVQASHEKYKDVSFPYITEKKD